MATSSSSSSTSGPSVVDPRWLVDHNDYAILDFVSAGTYGTVFRARNLISGELAALKFFDYSNCHSSEARYIDQEIQRQVEVVDIDGIVKIKGVFWDTAHGMLTGRAAKDDKGQSIILAKKHPRLSKVIVMELLNGGELFDKVAAKGAFSEQHASIILESVTRAFASMHARRRINRDFKLENCVFVHADPECLECKIIDLGFVKALPEGMPCIVENRHVGTEKFLAPESRMRPGATDLSSVYSPATDVWQLGCFLHIMICLHMPWDERGNESPKGSNPPDGFRMARKHCSAHANDLLDKIFTVDSARRITISGILAHPFISSRSELSAMDLGSMYSKRIKELNIRKRFRGMLQACVVTGRTQRERVLHLENHQSVTGITSLHITDLHFSQLRHAFLNRTGTDDLGNATLSRAGFKEVLNECGLGGLSHEAVFDAFDKDGSGGVDYYEFVVTLTAFRAPHAATAVDAQFMFDLLDLNSDHRVSFTEIKAVLGVLLDSHEIDDSDLLHLFDVMDNDHNDEVTIQEFRAFLEHNTTIASRGTTIGRGAGCGPGTGTSPSEGSPVGSPAKIARTCGGGGANFGFFGAKDE